MALVDWLTDYVAFCHGCLDAYNVLYNFSSFHTTHSDKNKKYIEDCWGWLITKISPKALEILHGVQLQGKLSQNGKHQHHAKDGWTCGIVVWTWHLIADHVRPTSIYYHWEGKKKKKIKCKTWWVAKSRIRYNIDVSSCQLTLVHGIHDKGNGNRQQNNSVHLRKGILVFRKGQNSNGGSCQHDGQMHPGEKGTFVGKEHFGFDLDRGFSRLDHFASCFVLTMASFLGSSKQPAEETTAASSTAALVRRGSCWGVAFVFLNCVENKT